MHKVNYWLIGLLLVLGLLIGMMSLYLASLSGVMSKMGLVGGDYRATIKSNELARLIIWQKGNTKCDIWSVGKLVPRYMLGAGDEKGELALTLGNQRVVCGIRLVQRGNVERGVYTIMKGLYYLKTHYLELRAGVERDRGSCDQLIEPSYEHWIRGYLAATEGRPRELVEGVYRQVQHEQERVEELCR